VFTGRCGGPTGEAYQKCTVLRPMGLFHMRFSHGSVVSDAVLCQRRDAGRRKEELKNWFAFRKAGRDVRKRVLVGAIVKVARGVGGRVMCVGECRATREVPLCQLAGGWQRIVDRYGVEGATQRGDLTTVCCGHCRRR